MMLETDPDSDKLFEQNLLDDFYPERPEALKDVSLYDFVQFYCKSGTDATGNREYSKLMKPKIVNHKLFDSKNLSNKKTISILCYCCLYHSLLSLI